MTVKDLIKLLETMPQNATVFTSEEGDYYPVSEYNIHSWTLEQLLEIYDITIEDCDKDYLNGAVYIG